MLAGNCLCSNPGRYRNKLVQSTWSDKGCVRHGFSLAVSRKEAKVRTAFSNKSRDPHVVSKNDNSQVRVCTNKTCRRAGSFNTLQHFRDLTDSDQVCVEKTGCLGQCGAGPNLVLLPSGLVLRHCSSLAQVARVVERQVAGGEAAEATLKAVQSKILGNAALEKGQASEAVAAYTKGLSCTGAANLHLLYGNRSAAYLRLGQVAQALEDADAAVALKPSWHKAHLRRADVFAAMGDYQAALEACHAALDIEDSLLESSSFLEQVKGLKQARLKQASKALTSVKAEEDVAT